MGQDLESERPGTQNEMLALGGKNIWFSRVFLFIYIYIFSLFQFCFLDIVFFLVEAVHFNVF